MEAQVSLSFVEWVAGFVLILLGGCWAIFKYFETKLNGVYRRMDENKAQFYNDFLLTAVYEAETRLKKENLDDRFERIVELFNEKIESLRHEIRAAVREGHAK